MFSFLVSSQLLEGVKTDPAKRKTKYFSICKGHLPSRKHLYQGQKTHIRPSERCTLTFTQLQSLSLSVKSTAHSRCVYEEKNAGESTFLNEGRKLIQVFSNVRFLLVRTLSVFLRRKQMQVFSSVCFLLVRTMSVCTQRKQAQVEIRS